MGRWLLTPIDHQADVWKTYPVQRIVIEAPSECEAREKIAQAADAQLPKNPWLDSALSSCEPVEED
jgi:hypothetical protein